MKFTELDKNEKTWGLYMNQNVICKPEKEAFLVRTEKCLLNKKFPHIFLNKEIGKL